MQRLLSLTFEASHVSTVRYIVDNEGGNIAALINGIKDVLGETSGNGNHAVTIDNIIVFSKEPGGVADLFFWAHEIQHTVQYKNLGIDGFAAKYEVDHASLERDADEVAERAVNIVQTVVAALSP
ncbi:hypothetical protein BH10PSE7_BH10PSE7_29660 [soil metagenome]